MRILLLAATILLLPSNLPAQVPNIPPKGCHSEWQEWEWRLQRVDLNSACAGDCPTTLAVGTWPEFRAGIALMDGVSGVKITYVSNWAVGIGTYDLATGKAHMDPIWLDRYDVKCAFVWVDGRDRRVMFVLERWRRKPERREG